MDPNGLTQVAPAAASMLALAIALLNLYLGRKDRHPRLGIRARYEYRASSPSSTPDEAILQMHDDSQEGLYMRLGAFLREHGLEYPQGTPLVRFSLSNEGDKPVYLEAVRLILRKRRPLGERLVLDPTQDKLLPLDLAHGSANVIRQHGEAGRPVEIAPGDGVGYKFELVRLSNTLKKEGRAGRVRLALEATDRLGNAYRRPFSVDTDLWAFPEE